MRMVRLSIENFRSLRSVEVPLSLFVCAVGHNNAGKSSLLIAIDLFLSGGKITRSDFYDTGRDVVITAWIEDLGATDIDTLAEEHRPRIAELAQGGKLTVVRRYGP